MKGATRFYNAQRKRTKYYLSNKDEEKKKAMDDAEKNLKLLTETKKKK